MLVVPKQMNNFMQFNSCSCCIVFICLIKIVNFLLYLRLFVVNKKTCLKNNTKNIKTPS